MDHLDAIQDRIEQRCKIGSGARPLLAQDYMRHIKIQPQSRNQFAELRQAVQVLGDAAAVRLDQQLHAGRLRAVVQAIQQVNRVRLRQMWSAAMGVQLAAPRSSARH